MKIRQFFKHGSTHNNIRILLKLQIKFFAVQYEFSILLKCHYLGIMRKYSFFECH